MFSKSLFLMLMMFASSLFASSGTSEGKFFMTPEQFEKNEKLAEMVRQARLRCEMRGDPIMCSAVGGALFYRLIIDFNNSGKGMLNYLDMYSGENLIFGEDGETVNVWATHYFEKGCDLINSENINEVIKSIPADSNFNPYSGCLMAGIANYCGLTEEWYKVEYHKIGLAYLNKAYLLGSTTAHKLLVALSKGMDDKVCSLLNREGKAHFEYLPFNELFYLNGPSVIEVEE